MPEVKQIYEEDKLIALQEAIVKAASPETDVRHLLVPTVDVLDE